MLLIYNNCWLCQRTIVYVTDFFTNDLVSSFCSQLNWLPIRLRWIRTLTGLYSNLNIPSSPIHWDSYFQLSCNNHDRNLRSCNNLLFRCPSHAFEFVGSLFVEQSVHLWNELRLENKINPNTFTFKAKVK